MSNEEQNKDVQLTVDNATADLKKMIDLMNDRHPELDNLERLKAIQDVLSYKISETSTQIKGSGSEEENRLTAIATAVGAATGGGLIAATVLPTLPWVTIASVLVGFIGGRAVSEKIDQFVSRLHEKKVE